MDPVTRANEPNLIRSVKTRHVYRVLECGMCCVCAVAEGRTGGPASGSHVWVSLMSFVICHVTVDETH